MITKSIRTIEVRGKENPRSDTVRKIEERKTPIIRTENVRSSRKGALSYGAFMRRLALFLTTSDSQRPRHSASP